MAARAETQQPKLTPIYRLADQLDAALALAEDLLQLHAETSPLVPGDANAKIAARHRAIADFARAARALELGVTARLLQARARASEVRALHPRFAPLLGLLVGGTAPLADAAADLAGGLGDISAHALVNGPDVLQFLVSRGLLAVQTRSLAAVTDIDVTEDYLLAANIHLGTLMTMIAQVLDSLDLAFDLYAEPRATVTIPESAQL